MSDITSSALDSLFDKQPVLLSAAQAAELLGKTQDVIYRWLRDGSMPGYKMGSTWYIPRDQLKAELLAGYNRATETD